MDDLVRRLKNRAGKWHEDDVIEVLARIEADAATMAELTEKLRQSRIKNNEIDAELQKYEARCVALRECVRAADALYDEIWNDTGHGPAKMAGCDTCARMSDYQAARGKLGDAS